MRKLGMLRNITSKAFAPRIKDMCFVTTERCKSNIAKHGAATAIWSPGLGVQSIPQKTKLDCENYREAYAFRKTSEIARALFVFKLCSYQVLVRHSLTLMEVGKMIIGRRLYSRLMGMTIGGQFVGGETTEQLMDTVQGMKKAGMGPMLCIPLEEDVGNHGYKPEIYEKNCDAMLECIDMATKVDHAFPMSQMKLTAVVPGNTCGILSKLIVTTGDDNAYLDNIIKVFEGRKLVLDDMDKEEKNILYESLLRLKKIGEHAKSQNVRLLLDAEYTYLNPALRLMSVAMMLCYNKQRPLVSYTYQNYLKETHNVITRDVAFIRSRGACFGAKVVRGAYMMPERVLAAAKGYPDPVHDCFEDTTRMYHKTVDYLLDKVSREADKYFVIFASHNEDTVNHVLQGMNKRGIPCNGGSVFFGQLYGMCDYLSSSLGSNGYLIYKSIPYGDLEGCLPYLHRRAVENSSILGGTQKERKLLWRAFLDRLFGSYRQKHAT